MSKLQTKNIKLAIVHPSPYPVKLPIFDIVCRQTDGIVLFSSKNSVDHPEWNVDEVLKKFSFRYLFLSGFRIKRVDVRPSLFWNFFRYKPRVIVTTEFNLQTIFSYVYARFFGSKILIQSNATILADAMFARRESFRKWLIGHCDGFIANSTETKKYLCSLGASPEEVTISIQTIDVKNWKNEINRHKKSSAELKKELGLKEKVVICVSRMQPKKGIHLLLEAFSNVSGRLRDVSLLLVGTGPEEQRLRDYCEQKGIMDRVVFAGYKKPMDMPKYYALADLFVFPTLYDKFGLVVIEALASGLPVLCSKFAGSAFDLIKDNENGYIIDPNDVEKMSGLLVNIMTDEILLQRLGQGALDIVDNFTVEKSAENFVKALVFCLD